MNPKAIVVDTAKAAPPVWFCLTQVLLTPSVTEYASTRLWAAFAYTFALLFWLVLAGIATLYAGIRLTAWTYNALRDRSR